MPTVLKIKGYRFFFYSNEGNEPIHIHVEKSERYAKFWLDPIRISIDFGFNSKEIREIYSIIEEHRKQLTEKWDEYFAR